MVFTKTEKEIELIREGGIILNNILNKVCDMVGVGVNTADLEDLACELIKKAGGRPSFKGYKIDNQSAPFPTALCTSINEEIVHAPAKPGRILKDGDIIGIDIGMEYPIKRAKNDKRPVNPHSSLGGYYTDMARTIMVGKVNSRVKELVDTTKKSLDLAIAQIKPGNKIFQIGQVIEELAQKHNFSVVRDLVGHGVGIAVHEPPNIFNYANKKEGSLRLRPGMVIAIEPMLTMGTWRIEVADDNTTFKTADNSFSAHFEHTVAVTNSGYKILTK